jgi:hypothetical protein
MKRARAVLTLEGAARALQEELRGNGNAQRRLSDRRYLKMDTAMEGIANFGANSPTVTSVTKDWAKQHIGGVDDVVSVSTLLWAGFPEPVYDMRLACVKLLRQHAKKLPHTFLPTLEGFIDTAQTWALVDELAMHVARYALHLHPVILPKRARTSCAE